MENLEEKQRKVLSLFWHKKVASRSDVARALKLSRPTASYLVDSLIEKSLLIECGTGYSTGGKPPQIVSVNSNIFSSIGIDIGFATEIKGCLIDANGEITQKYVLPHAEAYSEIVENVVKLINKLRIANTIGVGIAVSGIVDPKLSSIIFSSNFDLTNRPLAQEINEKTNLSVYIDNRSRMAARAEFFAGVTSNERNFLLLSLGKSVGSAFYINGKLFAGKNGKAGEISSIMVSSFCGDGYQSLEQALNRSSFEQYSEKLIAQKCAEGLRQILAFLDIECIVLSGRFADMSEEFIDTLNCELSCNIKLAKFGSYSAAYGASLAIIENRSIIL